MQKITLRIEGMHCGMCASHINDVIRNNFNVKKLKSDFKTGKCVFISDDTINQEKIKKVVDPTGYRLIDMEIEPYKKTGFLSFLKA